MKKGRMKTFAGRFLDRVDLLYRLRVLTAIAVLLSATACGGSPQPQAQSQSLTQPSASTAPWVLVWSDEFNGTTGAAPDPAKWVIEAGGHGWGNNELQYYTARPENVRQENGNLVITAIKEEYTGTDGVTRQYTSARLKTAGLFSQTYGKFEARIKVPRGQGIWPAFWMLGNDITTVGWPTCGEIDIMENIGKEPSIVHGSLHGPEYSGANPLSGLYTLPNLQKFADDFHVFAVEWEANQVRFYVDGVLYQTRTSADVPSGARWVYDHPFFMLLNTAVGGNWPGNPDATTVFPRQMFVDYVRVYRRQQIVLSVGTSGEVVTVFR